MRCSDGYNPIGFLKHHKKLTYVICLPGVLLLISNINFMTLGQELFTPKLFASRQLMSNPNSTYPNVFQANSSHVMETNRGESINNTSLPLPHETAGLPACDRYPATLTGTIEMNLTADVLLTLPDVASMVGEPLDPAGAWRPHDCLALDRITVVVPFRDRWPQLSAFLLHVHPMLRRQKMDYSILVVEQYGQGTFNKGRLMNVGFLESQKLRASQCVIFHDVDQLPETDHNLYACAKWPQHHCVLTSSHNYRAGFGMTVGGALNVRVEHFKEINGYANVYWGWGGEDDDMYHRIHNAGLKLVRPPKQVTRYRSVKHDRWRKNPHRVKLLRKSKQRQAVDGLNNLNYTVLRTKFQPLFVHILVDIGPPPQ